MTPRYFRLLDRELFERRRLGGVLTAVAVCILLTLLGNELLGRLLPTRFVALAILTMVLLLVLLAVNGFGRAGQDYLGRKQTTGLLWFYALLFDWVAFGCVSIMFVALFASG